MTIFSMFLSCVHILSCIRICYKSMQLTQRLLALHVYWSTNYMGPGVCIFSCHNNVILNSPLIAPDVVRMLNAGEVKYNNEMYKYIRSERWNIHLWKQKEMTLSQYIYTILGGTSFSRIFLNGWPSCHYLPIHL